MPSSPAFIFWYLVTAVVVSIYQAYRGFMLQWVFGSAAVVGTTRRVLLLCIADMITYFACTFSGFITLAALADAPAPNRLPSSAGAATWLIFLALYSLLGITGKLPDLLAKLKFPGAGE